jgi:hypothetical protein
MGKGKTCSVPETTATAQSRTGIRRIAVKSSITTFRRYNRWCMDTVAHILSALLVPLFFVGMVGSIIVVIFTILGDLRLVLTTDEDTDGPDL